jgi:hypothetical protein
MSCSFNKRSCNQLHGHQSNKNKHCADHHEWQLKAQHFEAPQQQFQEKKERVRCENRNKVVPIPHPSSQARIGLSVAMGS